MIRINLPKATHQGELDVNGISISCAVLDNGQRVLSARSVMASLGRKWKGTPSGTELPVFISAKNLKDFISNELKVVLNPISYTTITGAESSGYSAELLPLICDVYIRAEKSGVLTSTQIPVAERAYKLLSGFATVGIIALIDEATGYQYERERDELQKILKAYISNELLPWQKQFPDIYYKELFRLNGWDFTVNGIKKRPGVIGKWTNTLIYDELPDGVLAELRKNTPKSKSGNYTARLHQSLTTDVGNPHLTAQINQMIVLFQLSDNMKHMWSQFKKLKSRKQGQFEIPFKFDRQGHTKELKQIETQAEPKGFDVKLKQALDYNPKE